MTVIPLPRDVEYPESDGQPMAETGLHAEEMMGVIGALKEHFRDAPDVYVCGNQFMYWVKGDPRSCLAPDVYVLKDTSSKEPRRTIKVWEEGRAPACILEITSDSTQDEDLDKKWRVYQQIGVEEYFLHELLADYLQPPLQGFRLEDGRYRRIAPDPEGWLESRTLGLRLRRGESGHLQFLDAASGEPLLRPAELGEKARQAEAARRQAEAARRQAEAAHRQAEAALEQEQAARQALEEELARLRRELGRSD